MKIHLFLACLVLAAFHSTLAMPNAPKLVESMEAGKELKECPAPLAPRFCPADRVDGCTQPGFLESLSELFPPREVGIRPVCTAAMDRTNQS